jgi:hypothetical protein
MDLIKPDSHEKPLDIENESDQDKGGASFVSAESYRSSSLNASEVADKVPEKDISEEFRPQTYLNLKSSKKSEE